MSARFGNEIVCTVVVASPAISMKRWSVTTMRRMNQSNSVTAKRTAKANVRIHIAIRTDWATCGIPLTAMAVSKTPTAEASGGSSRAGC